MNSRIQELQTLGVGQGSKLCAACVVSEGECPNCLTFWYIDAANGKRVGIGRGSMPSPKFIGLERELAALQIAQREAMKVERRHLTELLAAGDTEAYLAAVVPDLDERAWAAHQEMLARRDRG